jgi:hypothetical protein
MVGGIPVRPRGFVRGQLSWWRVSHVLCGVAWAWAAEMVLQNCTDGSTYGVIDSEASMKSSERDPKRSWF